MSGIATIRSFGWSKPLFDSSHDLIDQSAKPLYLLYCSQRWLSLVLDLIVAGIAVLLVALATQIQSLNGSGFTGAALFNVASLAQTMTSTVITWSMFEVAMGAVSRIQTFEKTTPKESSPSAANPPRAGLDWPSNGSIDFRNITASYE